MSRLAWASPPRLKIFQAQTVPSRFQFTPQVTAFLDRSEDVARGTLGDSELAADSALVSPSRRWAAASRIFRARRAAVADCFAGRHGGSDKKKLSPHYRIRVQDTEHKIEGGKRLGYKGSRGPEQMFNMLNRLPGKERTRRWVCKFLDWVSTFPLASPGSAKALLSP